MLEVTSGQVTILKEYLDLMYSAMNRTLKVLLGNKFFPPFMDNYNRALMALNNCHIEAITLKTDRVM